MFVGNERKITVSRDNLLEALKAGLATHNAAYKEAKANYEKATVAFVEDALNRVKSGDFTNLDPAVEIQKPRSQAAEYEKAIKMIEFSVEDQIVIDENTFNRWVNGDWGWAREFELAAASSMSYLSKGMRN